MITSTFTQLFFKLIKKFQLLSGIIFCTLSSGYATVYYACGTGITWDGTTSFVYTASDCSGSAVNPNTLTSSDEMVIQAGAVITVEGNITLNAIKLTVFGTLFIHTPAIAGKLTLPDNSATVVFEPGSAVGCTDDGVTSAMCADASQIIVGNGASKWTYKGSDIDDFDDLPKPSIMDNTGGSLPIDLLYFDGHTSNSSIILIWATSYEENFDYFELEKSVNAVDFTTLGQVYAKGGLDLITHYQFIDESPFEDINYYRLKSIDHDGTFEYHPVISAKFDGTFVRDLLVYPNPVQGKGFTIRPNFDFNKALIRIKDLNGRMVLNEVQEYPSKIISITSYLEAGIYLLEFVTKEDVELEKLVVK